MSDRQLAIRRVIKSFDKAISVAEPAEPTPLDESAAKALGLRPEALNILLHTLGIQHRCGRYSAGGWRNYYSTHSGADSFSECRVLEVGGWMRGHGSKSQLCDGEMWTFRVTEAGIAALRLAGWEIKT